jgi:biotin transporter BioY
MFVGFWLGRVIAYFVMISVSPAVFRPFIDLFTNELYGIILFDSLGILSVIIFASIDWQKLIMERKLAFIRPRFRK